MVFSCPSSSRPTLVTDSLTHSLIVLDSKHSSLPDQTPSSEVDKVADMEVNVPDEDFSDTYLTNGDIYGDEL